MRERRSRSWACLVEQLHIQGCKWLTCLLASVKITSRQHNGRRIDPTMRPCQQCGTQITSTYAEMSFCPPCSNSLERCMICADHAPVAGNYIPPKTLNQGGAPPPGAVYAMPDPGSGACGACAKRGSTLPPPPPPSQSQSPSRRMLDFDWRAGSGSPSQQPPPPPPPPSRGGTGPSQSHRPKDTSRPAPRESLGQAGTL